MTYKTQGVGFQRADLTTWEMSTRKTILKSRSYWRDFTVSVNVGLLAEWIRLLLDYCMILGCRVAASRGFMITPILSYLYDFSTTSGSSGLNRKSGPAKRRVLFIVL